MAPCFTASLILSAVVIAIRRRQVGVSRIGNLIVILGKSYNHEYVIGVRLFNEEKMRLNGFLCGQYSIYLGRFVFCKKLL